jgi:hypothetical protein
VAGQTVDKLYEVGHSVVQQGAVGHCNKVLNYLNFINFYITNKLWYFTCQCDMKEDEQFRVKTSRICQTQ